MKIRVNRCIIAGERICFNMPMSMTGFGRAVKIEDNFEISVEIKTVNHRYADYSFKVPRHYSFLEDAIKQLIKEKVSRGKIDVFVSVKKHEDDSKEISLNRSVAKSYIDALRTLGEEFGIPDDLTVSKVARFSDIFDVAYTEDDEEKIINLVTPVAEEALLGLCDMREREGKKLAEDVLSRNETIKNLVLEIEKITPKTEALYYEKLKTRINELLEGAEIDQTRIVTEAAIFADKIAIAEEITRLNSHLEEFRRIIAQNEPIGRKLDFLLQETGREINTIGSKANDLEIAKLVVEVKSELEKIREQIQNIE